MNLFFYGTLRFVPLLELVLGRTGNDLSVVEGFLADHAVLAVKDEIFPAIESRPDATAKGVVVRGLTQEDLDRLNFYEGGFAYELRPLLAEVKSGETVEVSVYFPEPHLWQTGEEWDLDAWVEDWGALTLRAAEEVMSYYGRMSAEAISRVFPSIRKRASAWLAAQSRAEDPGWNLSSDVIVHKHKRAYINFFAMEEVDLQFRRYDGSMSAVVNRCAALVGRASVVLPYDPLRDQVLLIEQFRAATFVAGEKRPWMWEPIAGMIDPGETPEQAAMREAQEEAGLTLTCLEPVANTYPSSGASGEFIHIFVGIGDLSKRDGGGGLASEQEDIRSDVISFDQLMEGVDAGTYQDMPLVTAALWLARHRDRLRSAQG